MNCLLFKSLSDLSHLDFSDHRAVHIKKYLKPKQGDTIFVGIIGEFLAKAKISIKENFYSFEIAEKLESEKLREVEVAVALARPQIAQSILFDCACLGVSKLNFYIANKSEASYANSSLYTNGEYLDYLIRGAEQACNPFLPEFEIHKSLKEFLSLYPDEDSTTLRIAPDLYETEGNLSEIISTKSKGCKKSLLILGAERGFNDAERQSLREKNFHLGLMHNRVMRTDTALIYSLALLGTLYHP